MTVSATRVSARSDLRSRLHRTGKAVVRMRDKLGQDRILGMSAEAGFWCLVSLPSLVLAVFGSVGYFAPAIGRGNVNSIRSAVLRGAGDLLSSDTVQNDVKPIVNLVLSGQHADIVSISFIISLWSGSTATSAYLNTITVAYGLRGMRGVIRNRLMALWLYLLVVLSGIIMLPLLVLGPQYLADIAPSSTHRVVSDVVNGLYWPILVVLSVFLIAALCRLSLPLRLPWRQHFPGAVVSTIIWLGGALILRVYVTDKLKHELFYGALGAPLAALLFFYVTALAVLVGAEFNAALRAEAHAEHRIAISRSDTVPLDLNDALGMSGPRTLDLTTGLDHSRAGLIDLGEHMEDGSRLTTGEHVRGHRSPRRSVSRPGRRRLNGELPSEPPATNGKSSESVSDHLIPPVAEQPAPPEEE